MNALPVCCMFIHTRAADSVSEWMKLKDVIINYMCVNDALHSETTYIYLIKSQPAQIRLRITIYILFWYIIQPYRTSDSED